MVNRSSIFGGIIATPGWYAPVLMRPQISLQILVVDDEPLILEFIKMTLCNSGCRVTTVATAEEALALCDESPDDFDLVISDVVMPGMSGGKLAECVNKAARPIPVILMSGYPRTDPSVEALLNEPRLDKPLFLPKPFGHSQLLAAVSTAVTTRGWNAAAPGLRDSDARHKQDTGE